MNGRLQTVVQSRRHWSGWLWVYLAVTIAVLAFAIWQRLS
jgi:hypothetical protein